MGDDFLDNIFEKAAIGETLISFHLEMKKLKQSHRRYL
jgi:hypothetical protein